MTPAASAPNKLVTNAIIVLPVRIPNNQFAITIAPSWFTAFLRRITPWSLQDLSTLKEINHYHHDRDDQENVNEPAHRVRGDQTQRPEDDQNDGYGPEHFSSPPAVIQRQAFVKKWHLCRYPAEHSLVRSGRSSCLP
jgi:hypothetical protein